MPHIRLLTADYIFPVASPPLPQGVLAVEEGGPVLGVFPSRPRDLFPGTEVESYPGILCPGFVNTHCHLELSHLKGKIKPHTGFTGFALDLMALRDTFSKTEIQQAIEAAENEMRKNGIVAVGDISNTLHSFPQKSKKNMAYHTFVEVLGLDPQRAEDIFKEGMNLSRRGENNACSVSPHAPYSASQALLKKIAGHAAQHNHPVTIHNQESADENIFFEKKEGRITALYRALGLSLAFFEPTGKNSLYWALPPLAGAPRVQLVHNTFTSEEELYWAEKQCAADTTQLAVKKKNAATPNPRSRILFWCFCPHANLYIENRLPDFRMFYKAGVCCTIGTDSLASNTQLSVLEELKFISRCTPAVPLQTMLQWATLNGACFLGFEDALGSFEKGKKPGVVWIKHVDIEAIRLTPESSATLLIC